MFALWTFALTNVFYFLLHQVTAMAVEVAVEAMLTTHQPTGDLLTVPAQCRLVLMVSHPRYSHHPLLDTVTVLVATAHVARDDTAIVKVADTAHHETIMVVAVDMVAVEIMAMATEDVMTAYLPIVLGQDAL